MKLGRALLPALLTLITQHAHANALGAGTIKLIGGTFSSPASVYFGLDPAPGNRAACNTHSQYQFAFDASTPEGKALYSALLTAKSTGVSILIYGSGNCVLGQPMEGISYWILDPE